MLVDLILLNLYLLRARTVFEVEQTLVCNVWVQTFEKQGIPAFQTYVEVWKPLPQPT